MKRIDERDAMFSRMARKPGTEAYNAYYAENPEKRPGDDALRALPPMGDDSARFYHPHFSKMVDSTFHLLSHLNQLCEGPDKAPEKDTASPEVLTARVKALAELYGAASFGIAPLDARYYYTYKGRTDDTYGLKIEPHLPYTIVFAVPMDPALFHQSPDVRESLAVTKGYMDAGIIGLVLTYFIKALGFEARNHMDGNYQLVLPLAAEAAGLGALGKNGLIITPAHGSCVRLGAVTTDLPLVATKPPGYTLEKFCALCSRCSTYCPSKAIQAYGRPIAQEKCYDKWQTFGSDCGLCISVCPFSHGLDAQYLKATGQEEGTLKTLLKTLSPRPQYPLNAEGFKR